MSGSRARGGGVSGCLSLRVAVPFRQAVCARVRALRRFRARRSSSLMPPQTPASWPLSSAHVRHSLTTGQRRQTDLASAICSRAGPLVPTGKNSSGSSSRQIASVTPIHVCSAPRTARSGSRRSSTRSSALVNRFTSPDVLQGNRFRRVSTLTLPSQRSAPAPVTVTDATCNERSDPCPPRPVTRPAVDHARNFPAVAPCVARHYLGASFPQVRALCSSTVRRDRRTDRAFRGFTGLLHVGLRRTAPLRRRRVVVRQQPVTPRVRRGTPPRCARRGGRRRAAAPPGSRTRP